MSRIQLGAEIKFGPSLASLTDYSDEVSSLVLNITRNTVTRPATYGNPNEEMRAGARRDQVTINFEADDGTPSSLLNEFLDAAINTDSAELYFSAKYKDEPVSSTNPKYVGIILISDLDVGTAVNDWKAQSKTFPAREVAGPITAGS